MKTYRRMLRYVRPYVWPRGVAAVVLMFGYSALEGAMPFVVRYAGKEVFAQQRSDALGVVVVAVVMIGVLRGALSYGSGYLTDWVGQRVITDLRNELTEHMQRLDLAFFNRQRAGQIVSRVTSDVRVVRDAVTDAVRSVFQDSTTLVVLCVTAVYFDWVLALIGLLLVPVIILVTRYLSVQTRLNTKQFQEATGRLNAMLHETVQGNRVVKVFGREDFEAGRLHKQDELLFRLFMRASRLRSFPSTEILAGIGIALVIWYGGSSVIAGTRTPENFVAFVATLVLLYEPLKKLVRANLRIQQGIAGAQRAFGLLDRRSEVVDRPNARTLDGFRSALEFHDVSFAYEPGEPVLRRINLRIPVGHVVALVGMSGGGKSTIADLLPRLYDVTEGRITIDDLDLRDVTLASLRRQMAVVTQFTFLFNDTVRNNIAFGEPDRPMDDVIAAARAANAHEFIMSLPKGYDTAVGDLGVRLSGGQRQRLAIARAILRNAPILILDEATSALDTEAEGLVQEALERLMANRTSIVVAHRLSTIRNADVIVVLAHGRIVERGTHEELMARGGEYRKLYELQFREADVAAAIAAAVAE